jgi:hypothetical protein
MSSVHAVGKTNAVFCLSAAGCAPGAGVGRRPVGVDHVAEEAMMTIKFDDQTAREVLGPAVRPVLADWGVDEQGTSALVDVLVALFRANYGIGSLQEMLVQIEINLDNDD